MPATLGADLLSPREPNEGHRHVPRARRRSQGRQSRWRVVLMSGGAIIVLWMAASLALFVIPPTNQPTHVDAIVSFNGPNEGTREALAVSLAENGYAPALVFSQGGPVAVTTCPTIPHVVVTCFIDLPNNTRGEARWVARYAIRHHWRSLLLVPGRPQATRARLLVGRCFTGTLVVVPASEPLLRFPIDVLHEWGGLAKALVVNRGC
jgi:hypothetical protein